MSFNTRNEREVTWKLLDGIGLEHCRLPALEDGVLLLGTVVTVDAGKPVAIDYSVQCDRYWHTREVVVQVLRTGESHPNRVHLMTDGDGEWTLVTEDKGAPATRNLPRLAGCIDIDLAFTPATNTLPLRRHNLVVGASVEVTAAWLKFPTMELAKLPQRYTRTGKDAYRYESFDPGFAATIEVDDLGLVRTYDGLWERVAEVTPRWTNDELVGLITPELLDD